MMYDENHFTRDAAAVSIHEDADGITVDDDDVVVDWDDVETARVDDPPWANAFDSKEFYRIPATVARPIEQDYHYGEDAVTLKKPREELKKAAWSLDNAPFTLGHPDTGMVKNVDDVHGFWKNPRYVDGADDLDADLYVPVGDVDAMEHIEGSRDVSVGFYNRVSSVTDYDGVVGGDGVGGNQGDDSRTVGGSDDEEAIDGYQTDMLFDHVASVAVGRCASEEGCGLGTDASPHGAMTAVDNSLADAFKRGTRITDSSDEEAESMESTTDAPSGIHVADGKWFAVGPDEHSDDSTEYPDDAKYPVDSCSDVQDAWNLAGRGDVDVDESTIRERVKRVAEAKDCDLNTDESDAVDAIIDSAKNYSICGSRDVMDDDYYDSDCGCGTSDDNNDNTDMSEFDFELDDLSTDAALARVEDRHDGVAERLDELREHADHAEEARDAAEELDVDVDDLSDAVAMKDERIEELEQTVDELQRPKMEEDAEYIAEHTDRFGEDAEAVMEELDEDPDEVAAKRDLVEDLSEQYDERTANSGGDGGSDGGSSTEQTTDGYAKTPW